MKRSQWRQIGGDVNPGTYGATIARFDGKAVEIMQIQPVRSYVGDREGLEVGFPFWSKEAYYDPEDLDPTSPDMQDVMRSCDIKPEDLPKKESDRLLYLAEAAISYGYRSDEGPCGWAKDILEDARVSWWGPARARGWRYLADEDREFRALQREAKERDNR